MLSRPEVNALAAARGVKLDSKLPDLAAARAVVGAILKRDCANESPAYLAAALDGLAKSNMRTDSEARRDDIRPDVDAAHAAAREAHRAMRQDAENEWRQPLVASSGKALPRARAVSHLDSVDALRGAVAAARADSMREAERLWLEPLSATQADALAFRRV